MSSSDVISLIICGVSVGINIITIIVVTRRNRKLENEYISSNES